MPFRKFQGTVTVKIFLLLEIDIFRAILGDLQYILLLPS